MDGSDFVVASLGSGTAVGASNGELDAWAD